MRLLQNCKIISSLKSEFIVICCGSKNNNNNKKNSTASIILGKSVGVGDCLNPWAQPSRTPVLASQPGAFPVYSRLLTGGGEWLPVALSSLQHTAPLYLPSTGLPQDPRGWQGWSKLGHQLEGLLPPPTQLAPDPSSKRSESSLNS